EECLAVAVAMDPAISQKDDADFAAIAAVGMTERGQLHLFELFMERGCSPRYLIDKFFEIETRWDATLRGIESIAYQAALIHLMREEMFRRKRYFEVLPITHSRNEGNKDERILGILQPRYA